MTSYGDPNAGSGYDDEQYRQSYPAPAQSSGRASVPSADYGYDYSSSDQADYGQYSANGGGYPPQGGGYGGADQHGYGDQGYGQAPVNPPVSPAAGRASVGSSAGRATVGGRAAVGSAAVGSASVGGSAGRASVGRAGVRPAGLDMDDEDKPAGKGKNGKAGKNGKPKKKRNKLTIALAAVAVLIMLAGGGMIAFTSFLSGVPEPGQFKTQQNTLIFALDGKTETQVAQLGTENRRIVDMSVLDKKIKDTLIAGEDQEFYHHDGIDLWGIARAAWNNLTGGATQGASTITQQYARAAADDLEVSYARKLREAVWARELEQKYSKDEILGFYVNTAYFGRGATGVGAAARAYFGVDAEKLTVPQAAVLGAVLKQPEPQGDYKGYDPQNDEAAAKDRWNYVLNSVVKMGTLSQAEVDEFKTKGYPKWNVFTPGGKNNATWGIKDSSYGPMINYIKKEMETPEVKKALEALDPPVKDWKNGGLKITLTVNHKAQMELEKRLYREYTVTEGCTDVKTKKAIPFTLAEDGKTKLGADGKPLSTDTKKVTCRSDVTATKDTKNKVNSLLYKYPKNVTAAAVAIDPNTGGVLAYYGGMDGTTYDKAGKNGEGGPFVSGGHSPASSFKIYTLAAAVAHDISVESHWDPTPFVPKGAKSEIRNAGRDGSDAGCATNCTLAVMAQKSFNVPFYKVTAQIGPSAVVEMAKKAGVTMIWDDGNKAYDLTKTKPNSVPLGNHVGFGQYPITVLDHASGIATFAANGVYHAPHFIAKVERKETVNGKSVWKPVPGTGAKTKGEPRIESRIVGEVNAVLKNYSGTRLNDRDSVSKSGTWQAGDKFKGKNSSAWYVGYTPQIATAVWVGNYLHESEPILDPNKNNIGSGNLPKTIWTQFMNKADDVLGFKSLPIDVGCGGCIGDTGVGDGKESPTPDPNACFLNPQQPGCENQPGNPGNPGDPNNPNPNPNPTPSGTGGGGICIPRPGRTCP